MSSSAERIAERPQFCIVILEDDCAAAEAIRQTLCNAKISFASELATDRKSLLRALATSRPDLVIATNRLAELSISETIALVQENSPGVPVIVVTAGVDEETAVKLARPGAHDCVTRDSLAKLAFAVEHIQSTADEVHLRRQIERDLVFNAAVLAAEHEASPDGILVVDPQGHMVSFNRKFVKMWGISPELAASRSDRLALDSIMDKLDDPEAFAERVRYLYHHPEDQSTDEVTLKDGRIFHRYTSPMMHAERNLGRVWFFHDITRYKQAEKKIQEDASQFRGMIEQELAGIFILRLDGTIAYVNPRFAAMLGDVPDRLVGRSIGDLIAEEDKDRAGKQIQDVVSGQLVSSLVDISLKRADGTKLPVLGQGTIATYLGKPAVMGVTLDVSELKNVQRDLERTNGQLREDATQFRGLVEQELAGIFILHTDAKVAYVNPRFAAMLGYALDEVLGKSIIEFIADESRAGALRDVEDLVTGRRTSSQTAILLRHKNGTVLDCLAHGTIAAYRGAPAIVGVLLDISDLKRAERTLERANRVLRTLSAGNTALVHATAEPQLLQSMCRAVTEIGGYRFVWIGFARQDGAKAVQPVAWSGNDATFIKSLAITWDEADRGLGPTGSAIRTGQTVVNQNFATTPALAPWRDEALKHGFGSSIALPLADGVKTFGSITIYAAEPDAFDAEEVKLLTELAGDLSYGIVSLRARAAQEESVQRLRRSMQATVLAIASTLELRDPYTAGHQRDVAKLAIAIANDMGVPHDDIEGIYLAGVVHDIGKIQIPAEILAKPGKLTKLEYQLVQTHAQAGYDIIKGVEFPWPVADMILQHHERLDGSGYPNGLKGERILVGARIIAVADVVQAMTAHRPYRAALGLDAALAEVEAGKGTKYDPPAVDACVALFRSKGFKFESELSHD